MRWFRIRKANIDQNFRDHFEEFGVEIVWTVPLRFYDARADGTGDEDRNIDLGVDLAKLVVQAFRNPDDTTLGRSVDIEHRPRIR